MNSAPALKNISFMCNVKSFGAPLMVGSPDNDRDVFAIHIGNLSKPGIFYKKNNPMYILNFVNYKNLVSQLSFFSLYLFQYII